VAPKITIFHDAYLMQYAAIPVPNALFRKRKLGMSDAELGSLGRDQGEPTEQAREVLRPEMLERGLEWPEDPVEKWRGTTERR